MNAVEKVNVLGYEVKFKIMHWMMAYYASDNESAM